MGSSSEDHCCTLCCTPPPNFSWVVPGLLAGSGWPSTTAHLRYLANIGITHVVTVMEDAPPMHTCPEISHTFMPLANHTSPTQTQIDRFIDIVNTAKDTGTAIAVHCRGGLGRSGTMLALYLVKSLDLSGREAIDRIRQLRPRSIESKVQEEGIEAYAISLNNNN